MDDKKRCEEKVEKMIEESMNDLVIDCPHCSRRILTPVINPYDIRKSLCSALSEKEKEIEALVTERDLYNKHYLEKEMECEEKQRKINVLTEANESFLQSVRLNSYVCPFCAEAINEGHYSSAKKIYHDNKNLQRRLFLCVEALKEISTNPFWDRCNKIAKATLAKIKGEKP